MTDQIIQSLVEAYKQKVRDRKGSTHDLFTDPLFTSLPVEKQVEVVQSYAASLAQDQSRPRLHKILTRAIGQGALTGVMSSIPAMMLLKTIDARAAVGLLGAAGGAAIAGIGGMITYRGEKDRHEKTNKYLIQLTKNHDIPTVIKVLDMNRKYEPLTLSRILKGSPESPIIDRMGPISTAWGAGKLKQLEEQELLR